MAAASISVIVGDWASTRMWTDNWSHVGPLCHYAPNLFAAISRSGWKRTIRDAMCPAPLGS